MDRFFDETRPMGYDELYCVTQKLKKEYDFLQSFSIGKSVLGRSIITYLLGKGRPCILYVGGHHALEYITSMLLVGLTEDLCRCYRSGEDLGGFDIHSILSACSVYIIPMLNPDGVEIHLRGASSAGHLKDRVRQIAGGDYSNWQANANGVDLNHNYNAGYSIVKKMEFDSGIRGPSPRRYGGPKAESEAETHALCNLCRRLLFHRAFALHSQGEEIYWQYGSRTPKNAAEIAAVLASSSGYRLSRPEEMASHGGFKDWFINVFARPSFTIEVGKGKNPLPLSDIEPIYDDIRDMLLLGLVL